MCIRDCVRCSGKEAVDPQPKIRKLHNIQSHNRSVSQYQWMSSDQYSDPSRAQNHGYESYRSTFWAPADLGDLLGLMVKHLPTTGEDYMWPETAVANRGEEAEAKAEAKACQCSAPGRSEVEPTRYPTALNTPRRFYRTFWRAMVRKALWRVDQTTQA